MEASLRVIMLDWFKPEFFYNVSFDFFQHLQVIDNHCSTGGFFVTTIMTSPRIPILLRIKNNTPT